MKKTQTTSTMFGIIGRAAKVSFPYDGRPRPSNPTATDEDVHRTSVFLRVARMIGLVIGMASASHFAQANEIFFDDFSDGSVTNDVPLAADGTPVRWTPSPDFPGDYDASSGDYVLTPTAASMDFLISEVLNVTLSDVSIRSQVRASAENGSAGLTARNQNRVGDTLNYVGGIGYFPREGGTIVYLGRNDPGDSRVFFGDFPVLPFDVRTEDAMLQLDVIGNELKLWGWRAGDPMPDEPQLVATDDTYSQGTMRILGTREQNDNIATFRFVQVADAHIPEPSTAVLCSVGLLGLLGSRDPRQIRMTKLQLIKCRRQ